MRTECEIMVDVETGGPIPVVHPLLAIGACRVEGFERTRNQFYRELKPVPDQGYIPAAVQTAYPGVPAADTIARLKREGTDPAVAATQFAEWVRSISGSSVPVFVAHNATFDFPFINALCFQAGVENPFGISGKDTKSYWQGLAGGSWGQTRWSSLPKSVRGNAKLGDHHPLHDAIAQTKAYHGMNLWKVTHRERGVG